jgi:putative phosphoribosyl transferase
VEIRAGTVGLAGYLTRPGNATGIVLFGHASATGRHSPFSRYLAIVLNQAGLGTLLVDLLTPDEQLHPANVLDISLLACRLARSTQWARAQPDVVGLPIGYLGAGTGAAAAIWAAAEPGAGIAAVVSCSGHTDLARASLGGLRAPTLLIAAGRDNVLLRANRRAQAELGGENRLEVVPGATFLFEERGTLAAVAGLAAGWFTGHLAPAGHPVT